VSVGVSQLVSSSEWNAVAAFVSAVGTDGAVWTSPLVAAVTNTTSIGLVSLSEVDILDSAGRAVVFN
jgi:hypothetical protein